MQIIKGKPDLYDVVVVGAGASGGVMATWLARQGVRVALIEGGPRIDTTKFNTHGMSYEYQDRNVPLMVEGAPTMGDSRTRGVGGKSLTWNAVSLRLSQRDLKGYTLEGTGHDWPIDYK